MKKLKLGMFIFAILLLLPFRVLAASNNTIKLDANKSGKVGEEDITFSLTESFDSSLKDKIKKIEFRIVVDDPNDCLDTDISYKKDSETINNWVITERSNTFTLSKETNGVTLYSGSAFLDISFNIKSTAKVDEVINITIDNVKFYYDEDDGTSTNTLVEKYVAGDGNAKSITVKANNDVASSSVALSNVALLKTLTVSQGSLSPEFDPEVGVYNVSVKDTVTRLTINAQCDSNCSSINQNTNGSYRNQVVLTKNEITTVTITVISEDTKNAKNYTVNIARGEVINDTADLKSLTISEGFLNPVFDASILEYTMDVGHDIDELSIKYEALKEDATVEVIGGTNLLPGENIVKIVVTSVDEGTVKSYIVTVNKEDNTSSSDLSSSSEVVITPSDEDQISPSKLLIILLIIFIALGIVGVAFYLIFKKKKDNKKKQKKKIEEQEPVATISHENDEELLELTKEFNIVEDKDSITNDTDYDKFN